MLLDRARVLGSIKEILKADFDNVYGVRYQTLMFTNDNNSAFMQNLLYLGFDIVKCYRGSAKMILPVGWMHIESDRVEGIEVIIDQLGRERITIHNKNHGKAILNRKFDYKINIVTTTDDFDKTVVQIIFTDQGKEFDVKVIPDTTVCDLMIDYKCNVHGLTDIFEESAQLILSEMMPNWQDAISYW